MSDNLLDEKRLELEQRLLAIVARAEEVCNRSTAAAQYSKSVKQALAQQPPSVIVRAEKGQLAINIFDHRTRLLKKPL